MYVLQCVCVGGGGLNYFICGLKEIFHNATIQNDFPYKNNTIYRKKYYRYYKYCNFKQNKQCSYPENHTSTYSWLVLTKTLLSQPVNMPFENSMFSCCTVICFLNILCMYTDCFLEVAFFGLNILHTYSHVTYRIAYSKLKKFYCEQDLHMYEYYAVATLQVTNSLPLKKENNCLFICIYSKNHTTSWEL